MAKTQGGQANRSGNTLEGTVIGFIVMAFYGINPSQKIEHAYLVILGFLLRAASESICIGDREE